MDEEDFNEETLECVRLIKENALKYNKWYMKHPGLTLYNKEVHPWVKKTDDELWEEFLKYNEKQV